MSENIAIEPMRKEFIVWRCLHGGPLARDTIDRSPPGGTIPWGPYRDRKTSLLAKLTKTSGTCAILARDGDQIVGHLTTLEEQAASCGMNHQS